MPLPSTIDEFLDLVRKSGVADEKRLTAYLEKLRSTNTMPPDPNGLAGILVRDGLLTHFQAEQLLQGKWRRFSIGKYKVLERIGAGGMGSVYLCEHKLMRRRVALKVLPTAKAEDPSALERFYREARAVAALDHPNIVRAYDIDQEDKLHFLVMEHVDGSNLQEIIKKSGAMDVLRACHYIRQAALGLQHAHETAGLVHRDIKPGNVLVDRNGIVKILDMGLARFFHDKEDILTQKYDENVLGTADYLAPEQALDSHSVDIRADIYSLGATFYYCLTARTPFAEGTVAQKLIWHQTRQPKPLRSFRPEVPEEIAAIIEKMMAKDVNQRYQTPQQVADALAPYTQTPIPPPPTEEMPQFSPAAMGGPETGTPTRIGMTPSPAPVPAPKKAWQVPGSSAEIGSGPPSPSADAPRRRGTSGGSAPTATRRDTSAERPPSVSGPASPEPPRSVPRPGPTGAVAPAATSVKSAPSPGNGRASTPAPTTGDWDRFDATRGPEPGPSRASARAGRGTNGKVTFTISRPMVWLLVGLAVAICLAIGLVIWLVLLSVTPATPRGDAPKRPTLFVGHVPNTDTFASVAEALRQVPHNSMLGARIILQQDIAEVLRVEKPNISIECEEGHLYTWRPPTNSGDSGSWLLHVANSENFRLSGVNFDGANQVKSLILLWGRCPGSRLENLTLKGFTQCGIWVTNCVGEGGDRRVFLEQLTFSPERKGQADIFFDLSKDVKTVRSNEGIVVQNCYFGKEGTPIRSKGPEAIVKVILPEDVHPDIIAP
jgi:serine/threonine protein kinase